MAAEPIIHALNEKIKNEYPGRREAKPTYRMIAVNTKRYVAVGACERIPLFNVFSKKQLITERTIHLGIISPNLAVRCDDLLGKRIGGQYVLPPASQGQVLAYKSQGMKNPTPRIQRLDGFNEGWIEFEAAQAGSRKGKSCECSSNANVTCEGSPD
jgi:hypothetical protein